MTETPVNPFAPKRTAQQWADDIEALIERAKEDGYQLYDSRKYSDSSTVLKIGTQDSPPDDDPIVWDEK